MSIPDFQSMMLPFLQLLADGKERFHKDILAELADKLGLSDEQQNLRHEKSGVNIFSNNITWVEIYLIKANLISKPKRACFLITEAGKSLLLLKPAIINIRLLKERYPSVTQAKEFIRCESVTIIMIRGSAFQNLAYSVHIFSSHA